LRVFKTMLLVVVGFGAITIIALLCIVRLAASPSAPTNMPQSSIWFPAPPSPLDFSPRGVWVACWFDKVRESDHCRLEDAKGHLVFDEDFTPVSTNVPVPDERLHLKKVDTMSLWTWVQRDERNVPVIRLEDGTILVPTRNLADLKGRYVRGA
jgi:hypothetical protein